MNYISRWPVLSSLIATLSLTTHVAFANDEERWFQVEVLIFENPETETDNPEQWPAFPIIEHPETHLVLDGIPEEEDIALEEVDADGTESDPELSTEVPPEASESGLTPFFVLDPFEHRLAEQAEKLNKQRGYRVLFHQAWNQPVPGRDEVIPIRIEAGETFGRQAELQGYLSLYVERYLHFSADLHLIRYQAGKDPFNILGTEADETVTAPLSLDSVGGLNLLNANKDYNVQFSQDNQKYFVAIESAQMKESRRLRSRTLHYLDHPRFGLLLTITPIELQQ